MKRTIIYVGAFKLPSGNTAAQRVRGNTKIFRDLGYRVILVGAESLPTSRLVVRKGSYARDGFHSLCINLGGGRFSKLTRRLSAGIITRIIRMRFGEKAVVCYNHASLSQGQIQLYCKWHGIPFSPDATEWYGADGGSALRDGAKWADTTLRMRVLNPLSDAIITTSPFLARFYGRPSRPLLQLPTLYDRSEMGEPLAARTPGAEPIHLVYAGNPFNLGARKPHPEKMKERLDKILDLLALVNSDETRFTLDIYGLTRQQYLQALPSYAPLVEESAWLRFNGSVSLGEVIRVVKQADFTIFLRDRHRVNMAGFPSKFAESITCGTPSITNLMENIAPFAIDRKNCILIEPDDIAASAAILAALHQDRELVRACKEYCAQTNPFDYRNWIEGSRAFAKAAFGDDGQSGRPKPFKPIA